MERGTTKSLQARSAMARWLSGAFAGTTSPDTAEVPVVEHLPELGAELRAVTSSAGPEHTPYASETERVRLMVNASGGIAAPPYGSWWLEETLQGQTTSEVASFYRKEGLRVDPSAGPADFLGAEMEFLYFLLQHQIAARMTNRNELEQQGREAEREFTKRFLLPWIPRFCAAGRNATSDRYWKAMFDLLEAFVQEEMDRVTG